jgi:hypothetical protein
VAEVVQEVIRLLVVRAVLVREVALVALPAGAQAAVVAMRPAQRQLVPGVV